MYSKLKALLSTELQRRRSTRKPLKKLVLGETHELRSPFSSLSRCVRSGQIKTRICEKKARVTSNKRVFDIKSGASIPYGFLSS